MSLPSPAEIAAALIAREEIPPEKGDIGPQGMEGKAGGFGPPGPQGAMGNPGRDGQDGSNGDIGPVGPRGKQGDRGLKGDKGDKGDQGERGIQGVRGETGAAGSGRSLFPRGGGGSSSLTIQDEGAAVVSTSTVDFAGAGVSVAQVGAKAVVTIPGGGGGLPPQWTDGGNGDVTAEADAGFTPLTVIAPDDPTHAADFTGLVEIVMQAPNRNGLFVLRAIAGAAANDTDIFYIRDEDDQVRFSVTANGGFRGSEGQFGEDGYRFTSSLNAEMGVGNEDQRRSISLRGAIALAATDGDGGDVRAYLGTGDGIGRDGKFIVRNWSDDTLFAVLIDGQFLTRAHAAPADADLAAGDGSFWFDQTNGAASPMWKGKSADGTVVSGSLGGGGGSGSFLSIAKWA